MTADIIIMLGLDLDDNDLQNLIDSLETYAKSYIVEYCGLSVYDAKFDPIVMKMVLQDYTKIKSQGISAQSYSGVSETYIEGYSKEIMDVLKRNRKVKFL